MAKHDITTKTHTLHTQTPVYISAELDPSSFINIQTRIVDEISHETRHV